MPTCPRCGYDLSGHVATWDSSCPVEGQCSECGLEFAWTVVMRPDLQAPRWSFEHAPASSMSLCGTCVESGLRALFPLALRGLAMWHPIRKSRLALLPIAWATVALITFSAFSMGLAAWASMASTRSGVPSSPVLSALLALRHPRWAYETISSWQWYEYAPPVLPLIIATALVMPITFLLLGTTMRSARVRRVHLFRLGVLSTASVLALWLLWIPLHAIADPRFAVRIGALRNAARFLDRREWILAAAWLAWLAWFWWWAIARYLRLPHAWSVLLGLLGMSALVGGVVQVVMYSLTGERSFLELSHRWW